MPSNSPREKNAAPPLPEPLRVPVADSHTHLDMQAGTVDEALAKAGPRGGTQVLPGGGGGGEGAFGGGAPGRPGRLRRGRFTVGRRDGRAVRRRPRDRRPAPQRG